LAIVAVAVPLLRGGKAGAAVSDAQRQSFIAAAQAMRREAERAGDQPYGAVVVREGTIVGWGPSRVVLKKDWAAHAEREAIADARARLGSRMLAGCVLYSTSRPCANCESVAAEAGMARMFFGPDGQDAGAPRARP
jgi:tRNA(adenine34) deaminase